MPNFRGKRFTNAHETLIWAARDQKSRAHLQLREPEGAERRPADALRLAVPDLLGAGAAEGRRRAQGASDAEAGGAAAPRAARLDEAGRRRARSLLRHRHDGRRRQAARPPLHRHRARPRLRHGRRGAHRRASSRCRSSALETVRSKRAEPRVPFGTIVELGMLVEPGAHAVRRAPRDPRRGQGRRHAGAAAGNQGSIHRLGAIVQGKTACNGWTYLALRGGRQAEADRSPARARPSASSGFRAVPAAIAAE